MQPPTPPSASGLAIESGHRYTGRAHSNSVDHDRVHEDGYAQHRASSHLSSVARGERELLTNVRYQDQEIESEKEENDEQSIEHAEEIISPDSHAESSRDGTRKFSGRLPLLAHSSGRTTLVLLTDWLDLAFSRLGLHSQLDPTALLSSRTQSASAATGDWNETVAITTSFPPIPPLEICHQLISTYFANINPVFSLFDCNRVLADLKIVCLRGPKVLISERGLPSLLRMYLILSLGAMGGHDYDSTAEFTSHVTDFCRTLLGHVIGWNTLEAVQIVFLISLSLRSQDRLSASWSSIGLCVSMATSLGLNRRVVPPSAEGHAFLGSGNGGGANRNLEIQRTWWCIYTFEKLHAFELGRASSIIDTDCDQIELDEHTPPSNSQRITTLGPNSELPVFLSLAKVLSGVLRKCVRARNREDRAITESTLAFKVNTTGESCLRIVEWAAGLDTKYQ